MNQTPGKEKKKQRLNDIMIIGMQYIQHFGQSDHFF